MAESFDPYRKWLGIPKREQPPNHYRLLALDWFEDDPEVIEAAADRQMAHLRTYQGGRHADDSQRLLNELSAARVCLLNPERKAAYDAQLRAKLAASGAAGPAPPMPFGFFVKGAAQYFAVEVRRFWLEKRRLAANLRELGRLVFQRRQNRDRLAQIYTRLESLAKYLESLQQADGTAASAPPLPSQPAASRPGLLRRIGTNLRGTLLGFQRGRLLEQLGRETLEIDPAGCGPEALLQSIRDQQAQLKELGKRIVELSEVPPGQFLSPKRLAWIVLGVVAMVVLLLLAGRHAL
jgi:hypothetical protein